MTSFVELSISQPFIGENDNYFVINVKNNLDINTHKRLYLLLDISGSMSGERISLVVHACKAIIKASNETIEISIFVFGSQCNQLTELKSMDDNNKQIFLDTISKIKVDGSTNLILGLNTILNYIKSNHSNIDTHCIVFTDGEPDDKTINNYSVLLNSYLNDANFNCIIDVFGFGTSLNLEIIETIYSIGKGIFSFISDRNMMATIFNNYIANLFSTSIINTQFRYEIENEITGDIDFSQLDIGNIQSGQTKNYVITIPKNNKLGFSNLKFLNLATNSNETYTIETIPSKNIEVSEFILHKIRYELIIILSNINNLLEVNQKILLLYDKYKELLSKLEKDEYTNDIEILLLDIISDEPAKGQIMKAIINYHIWGSKYLISLKQSHINQTTINFKDESIQKYSGTIAKNNLNTLNQLFDSIQYIPIESCYYGASSSYYYGTPTLNTSINASSINASSFNNRYAGCFDGKSLVQINIDNDIKTIMLKDLKYNDIIFKDNNSVIKIEYIMKTKYNGQQMINFNNLIGTSMHPIFDEKRGWIYLKDSHDKLIVFFEDEIDYLYSVSAIQILNDGSSKNVSYIILNGIKCATFGHQYLDKDENDIDYTILASKFWGNRILSIFKTLNEKKLLDNNVLTLNDNYKFIRNEKGWCIGIEIYGFIYY